MISYWIGPYSANELTIQFDLASAEEFLSKLKKLDGISKIETISASKINKLKSVPALINLRLTLGDDELVVLGASFLTLIFTEDAIEYAEFKITKYINKGFFSPAEFLTFRQEKTGKTIRIYFVSQQ